MTNIRKTYLITGGAGFIGSAVIRQLLTTSDVKVVNIDKLTYAANLMALEAVENHYNYTFIKADINDNDVIKSALKNHEPDVVMHLAAESHVDRSIVGSNAFIRSNIVGTYSLLENVRNYWESLKRCNPDKASRFRFQHISTDEVFGDLEIDDPAFTESTPYQPSSPYSASKASSDHLVRAWHRTYGLPVIVTNCSNNYGPYQYPEKLIPNVIAKALRHAPIPVYGTGNQIRDWIYIDDHVKGLLLVAERGVVGETYLIGGKSEGEHEISNLELVTLICDLIGEIKGCGFDYQSLIELVTDRAGHDFRYAVNSTKIREELGWAPSVSLQEGLRQTVCWYLENEEKWDR